MQHTLVSKDCTLDNNLRSLAKLVRRKCEKIGCWKADASPVSCRKRKGGEYYILLGICRCGGSQMSQTACEDKFWAPAGCTHLAVEISEPLCESPAIISKHVVVISSHMLRSECKLIIVLSVAPKKRWLNEINWMCFLLLGPQMVRVSERAKVMTTFRTHQGWNESHISLLQPDLNNSSTLDVIFIKIKALRNKLLIYYFWSVTSRMAIYCDLFKKCVQNADFKIVFKFIFCKDNYIKIT